MDAICEALEAVTDGSIQRLIINVPPGCSKSTLVSVMWPAWEWLQDPGEQSLFCSYDLELALRDSDNCRTILKSDWYQNTFDIEWGFSKTVDAKSFYKNTYNGFRYTFGLNSGSKTGWRGRKIVVDDPNDVKQKHDVRIKQQAWQTYQGTLSTRINDISTARFLVIQQRCAHDDFTGRLMASEGHLWTKIEIPAEFERSRKCVVSLDGFSWEDPRTEEGQIFDPVRYPKDGLDYLRIYKLGEEDYWGQFQQRPSPPGGARFKEQKFLYWYDLGYGTAKLVRRGGVEQLINMNLCWTFVTCDFAASEEQQADFTVFSTWLVTPRMDLILLTSRRGRWAEPESVENAIEVYSERRYNDARHACFICEDNGLGLPIRQAFQAAGIPVLPVFIHRSDKFVRSATAAIRINAGQVFFPGDAANPQLDWFYNPRYGFKVEVMQFPDFVFEGKNYDDQVDTLSLAAEGLYEAGIAGIHEGQSLSLPQKTAVDTMKRGQHKTNSPTLNKFFGRH